MKIPFSKSDILVPKETDMTKWSVIACDQYTSEPDYWKDVTEIVGKNPSTLKITLPEIYLEESNVSERIEKVNKEMQDLITSNFFQLLDDSLIYVERTQADGRVRKGLIGKVDLEDYSFARDSQSLIRATEGTVIERIPPRVKVRENASLELPHIMLLIDDDKKQIIEELANKVNSEMVRSGFINRGIKVSNFHVLRETKCPAILVEVGFIDNTLDNLIFDSKFEKIAQSIVKGCLCHIGKSISVLENNLNRDEVYYRCVVGSFKERVNAEIRKAELMAKGYADAFIDIYKKN